MINNRFKIAIAFVVVCSLLSVLTIGPAAAADPIIYPAKEQSAEQMEKDKSECYLWAKEQTGFDPTAASTPAPAAGTQAAEGKSSRVGRGAVGGAVAGLAIGSLAGEAGKGAAIGAAGGGLAAGAKGRKQEQKQQQAQQQQVKEQTAQYESRRNEYIRAFGACLEGRGYTVK